MSRTEPRGRAEETGALLGNRELRRFGFSLGGALSVLGGLVWYRSGLSGALFPFGFALLVLSTALLAPRALVPLRALLERLLRLITSVLTRVLLVATFYLVVTPWGLLMRLVRRDPLQLRADPDRESYWVEAEAEGPADRPHLPY